MTAPDEALPLTLYRLSAWLSPSYPVGAFSYSHGIEYAVETGAVTDRVSLADWVSALLLHGSGRNDAIVACHAMRAARAGEDAVLAEVAAVGIAMAGCAERHLESTAQGNAFARATRDAWSGLPQFERWLDVARRGEPRGDVAYPVAVALACAASGISEALALNAYLHAFVANLVNAGLRLIPLGQSDGLRVIADLEQDVVAVASDARRAQLNDVSSGALAADLAAMAHETMAGRLFRT